MHPAAESLIQRKPKPTTTCHQPPPVITYTDKGMNAELLKTGFENLKRTIYESRSCLTCSRLASPQGM